MRIFRMNDCDWWMAETLEDAKRDYMASGHGLREEEALDDPGEVSDSDMDRLQFTEDDGKHSFRAELAIRVGRREDSQFFASTEY